MFPVASYQVSRHRILQQSSCLAVGTMCLALLWGIFIAFGSHVTQDCWGKDEGETYALMLLGDQMTTLDIVIGQM